MTQVTYEEKLKNVMDFILQDSTFDMSDCSILSEQENKNWGHALATTVAH